MTTSRREVLKKAATGTAIAGVAWSAPRVEGLSLRPSYAAATSQHTVVNVAFNSGFANTSDLAVAGNAACGAGNVVINGAIFRLASGGIGGNGNATVNGTGAPSFMDCMPANVNCLMDGGGGFNFGGDLPNAASAVTLSYKFNCN